MNWISAITMLIALLTALAAWYAAMQTRRAAEETRASTEAKLLFDFLTSLQTEELVTGLMEAQKWESQRLTLDLVNEMTEARTKKTRKEDLLAAMRRSLESRDTLSGTSVLEWNNTISGILESLLTMWKEKFISDKIFKTIVNTEIIHVVLRTSQYVNTAYAKTSPHLEEIKQHVQNPKARPLSEFEKIVVQIHAENQAMRKEDKKQTQEK